MAVIAKRNAESDAITDNNDDNDDHPSATASIDFYRWTSAAAGQPNSNQLTADRHHLMAAWQRNTRRMRLIDMLAVRLYDRDYLVVESSASDSQSTHRLTYLAFVDRKYRIVYESTHNATQNVVSMPLRERSCLGFFTEFASLELRIECAVFDANGRLRMLVVNAAVPVAEAPIAQIVYGDRDHQELIVLDVSGRVNVWRRVDDVADSRVEDAVRFQLVQSIRPLHLSRTISMCTHGGAMWLATCAAHQENGTHVVGSVDVYR